VALDAEGAEKKTYCTDALKIKCEYCGGTTIQFCKYGDDPDDLPKHTAWTAMGLTNEKAITCSVGLCQCGHITPLEIRIWDLVAFTGAEVTPDMTDLDASTADGLAGWWLCLLVGTNIYKYVRIASNTAATPTVLTIDFAMPDDSDGICFITNVEPTGWTRVSA